MMEKIDIVKATEYTSPNPVTVICTRKTDGTANLAPVSWFTYLSFNPATVCFAMGKPACSGENIRTSGKAVITIPAKGIEDKVVQCGMCTGRDTDKSGILDLVALEGTDIMIPAETKLAISVTLDRTVEVGDHYLYICKVDGVHGNAGKQSLFAWNGYMELAGAKKD